jgi:hypothetical protein
MGRVLLEKQIVTASIKTVELYLYTTMSSWHAV